LAEGEVGGCRRWLRSVAVVTLLAEAGYVVCWLQYSLGTGSRTFDSIAEREGEGCHAAAGIDRTPQSQANQSVCRVSFQKLACLELPNFRRPYVVLSLEFQFHHDGVSHELNVWAHGHAGL